MALNDATSSYSCFFLNFFFFFFNLLQFGLSQLLFSWKSCPFFYTFAFKRLIIKSDFLFFFQNRKSFSPSCHGREKKKDEQTIWCYVTEGALLRGDFLLINNRFYGHLVNASLQFNVNVHESSVNSSTSSSAALFTFDIIESQCVRLKSKMSL